MTEFEEAVEHGTVLADVEALHLLAVVGHVVRPDGAQKLDVIVAVELGHLLAGGLVRSVDLHFAVEAVVEQQVVGHPHAVGLHRVSLAIVVVADVAVVVVADLSAAVRRRRGHPAGQIKCLLQ